MTLAKGDYLVHKEIHDVWEVEEVNGDVYTIASRATIDLEAIEKYFDKVEVAPCQTK